MGSGPAAIGLSGLRAAVVAVRRAGVVHAHRPTRENHAGRLAPGDLAVFFLTAQGPRLPVTTGFTQGIYRVQRDMSSGEMRVVPPVIDVAGRVVRGDLRRKPVSLSAFEGTVRSVTGAR